VAFSSPKNKKNNLFPETKCFPPDPSTGRQSVFRKSFHWNSAPRPARRSFAVPYGEITYKTRENHSLGPSVTFHWTTEAKKYNVHCHCNFADPSSDINDIQRKPRQMSQFGKKSAKVYHSLYSSTEQLQVAL
jgi:hypothetical protein